MTPKMPFFFFFFNYMELVIFTPFSPNFDEISKILFELFWGVHGYIKAKKNEMAKKELHNTYIIIKCVGKRFIKGIMTCVGRYILKN